MSGFKETYKKDESKIKEDVKGEGNHRLVSKTEDNSEERNRDVKDLKDLSRKMDKDQNKQSQDNKSQVKTDKKEKEKEKEKPKEETTGHIKGIFSKVSEAFSNICERAKEIFLPDIKGDEEEVITKPKDKEEQDKAEKKEVPKGKDKTEKKEKVPEGHLKEKLNSPERVKNMEENTNSGIKENILTKQLEHLHINHPDSTEYGIKSVSKDKDSDNHQDSMKQKSNSYMN